MRTFIQFILFVSSLFSLAQNVENKIPKVVIILVDGIPTDLLYKTSTPYLDALSKEGAFSEAYVGGKKDDITQTPTISAVGYNSMLTGTWVNKHNVFGNAIKNPNYNYSTIFRLLKNTYPEKKIGVYSTWLDNRTKLLGDGLKETNHLKVDYHLDGLELDQKKYPHDAKKKYLKRIDAEVTRKATIDIIEKGPDLSWVYLEHPDDMGHMYGDSPQFREAIAYEDVLIGQIWDAVKLRENNTNEDWLIIITTDHGRTPTDAKHHGGQSDRERNTWIALNKPITNKYFQNNRVAIVDVFSTIKDFMKISIPTKTSYEIDGVSLIKPIDAFKLHGISFNNKYLHLNWSTEQLQPKVAKIFISYTNNFKDGETDEYEQIGSVMTSQKEFSTKIKPKKKSKYAKVVLETKNHSVSTWVKLKK